MRIKLDENLPVSLVPVLQRQGHDVHTVVDEQLAGRSDGVIWQAVIGENRFLITQDLDFSDSRRFSPGSHPGILLVRLRIPGAKALIASVGAIADQIAQWSGCFVVLTENKIRVKRPE